MRSVNLPALILSLTLCAPAAATAPSIHLTRPEVATLPPDWRTTDPRPSRLRGLGQPSHTRRQILRPSASLTYHLVLARAPCGVLTVSCFEGIYLPGAATA
jgi:hypothetical protein